MASKREEIKEAAQQTAFSGTDLFNRPLLNKGTAFTDEETGQARLARAAAAARAANTIFANMRTQ